MPPLNWICREKIVRADRFIVTGGRGPILNQMVKFSSSALDRTFVALSDPTRRALVMRLAAEPDMSVTELAAPFQMSLPAVMKHLDVLSDAGLVGRSKTGRTVACRLDAEPMRDAFEWLYRYQKFWSERLDRLAAFLEEEEIMATQTATKPSLTLKRRFKAPPAKVFAAWTDPEKVKRWMGPGEMKAVIAESDIRAGGHYRWIMQAPNGENTMSAASIARSYRTKNWFSPGPGSRRRSASRW